MLSIFSKPSSFRSKPLVAAPTIVVANGDEVFLYLQATPNGKNWEIESFGEIKIAQGEAAESEENDPNAAAQNLSWTDLLETEWRTPTTTASKGRRIIFCLQRPDVDFYPLQVLVDPQEDITESLHNELAIREKISLDDTTVDYSCHSFDDQNLISFVATLPTSVRDHWLKSAKQNNRKLEQIFVRPLATSSLLHDLETEKLDGSCLVVAVYGQQADLILLHNRVPCFIRNLVLPSDNSVKEITRLLLAEIRLSISTLDLPFLDDALANAVVLADVALASELIVQLKIELDIDGVKAEGNDFSRILIKSDAEIPTRFLPLLGSLQVGTQKPGSKLLDLLNTKQPVEPPSMMGRVALLSILLIVVLGYFGMNLYDQYDANFQEMKKIVAAARKDKSNYTEKLPDAKLVQYVQQWEQVEVKWLEQLQSLTDKLPSGDLAVIRQFSGEQTAAGAKISLQIHVRDLEVTEAIEQSIAESNLRLDFRQVVETSASDFPFRLDTTVFAPLGAPVTEVESTEK